MLDTGSEASIISGKFLNKISYGNVGRIKIPKITLMNARGKKMGEINESISIQVKIKNNILELQLLIMADMEYEIILGTDEMEKHKITIDYLNKNVLLRNDKISMRKMHATTSEDQYVSEYKELNCVERNGDNNKRYKRSNDDIKNEIKCNNEYVELVRNLLYKYKGLVVDETRVAKNYIHRIKVKDIENYKAKSYPIPYKYREEVAAEILKMKEQGIIENSNTPYINPIVVVKKSSGELRLCLDARNINKCSIPQYESPANIESIFGRITSSEVFTKIDLKHSFWLIPLHENSRDYTGFAIDGVVYRFKVVPYGVQSACAALSKCLHRILDKYDQFVVHYVDDILIYSKVEDHAKDIEIVLKELDEAGLKINLKKCHFYQEQVVFLGYVIDRIGIHMDPERVRAIMEYTRPKNLKMLRRFIGIINYFKRLVPDLSEKLYPLMSLLKKSQKWNWNSEKEEAFNAIKQQFCEGVQVYHPRYECEFTVRTDASMNKLAGVLVQMQDGVEVPVCFVSRVTKEHEKKYSVTELELMSVVFCVEKLRFYLLGNRFVIETDHQALISILKNKFVSNRIYRWVLILQEYDFEIKYVKGSLNVVADALTRDDGRNVNEQKQIRMGVNVMRENEGLFSKQTIVNDQRQLSEREKRGTRMEGEVYVKEVNGYELYVITNELTERIIKKIHEENGHVGMRKTWMIYRENYISNRDVTITKLVVSKCRTCQLKKNKNKHNYGVPKTITTKECFEIIAMDFVSDLIPSRNKSKHILVMVDVFSKYIRLYPTKRTNKHIVIQKLKSYMRDVGKPKAILVDNATYFQSDAVQKFCEDQSIIIKHTSIRHPCANPAERYIQEVIKYLRILLSEDQRDWEDELVNVERIMNECPNLNTEEAPMYVMKGERPERKWIVNDRRTYDRMIEEVRKRIDKKAKKYLKKERKKNRKRVKFKEGDLVIIRALRVGNRERGKCAKLQPPFEGPYEIITENPINSCQLKDIETGQIRGIFNVADLYKFVQE